MRMGLGLGLTAARSSGAAIDFVVTIPSGTVSADLTDFPVMVRLDDMPPTFWANVRSDGGNIRAVADDGLTLIPVDVTYINSTREIGRLYFKASITSASDTVAHIRLLATSETALAATDPNGRNAVWADYEVVWVFPEAVNRTGNTHTQVMTDLLAHSEWIRTEYRDLTGSPHNGISTDGTHFISCDDIILRRMNMSFVLQQTVTDINTGLSSFVGGFTLDHMGDPVCVGTSTFFTVTGPSGGSYRRWLVEYRTSDLTPLNAWEMTGTDLEFGATVCFDGTHLLIFSFSNDTKFIKYTTSGSYVGEVAITSRGVGMADYQGSTVLPSGNILISGDPNTIWEITAAGVTVGPIYVDPHAGIMEGLEYRDGNLWLLKGGGALITLRNDVHQDYRKLHGADVAYANLPSSTIWTASASVYWTTGGVTEAWFGVDDSSGTGGSGYANAVKVHASNNVATFNSTNSSLLVSPAFNAGPYDTFRVSVGHNGTSGRKIRVQEGATVHSASSGSSAARPSGANMDFVLNGNQRNGDGAGEGYYQAAWLRTEYLSDAWLEADGKNSMTPLSFYTIT